MKRHLAVLSLFTILTPIMTYPMVLHLADAVPGPPWDNFVWLYDLWWFKHSLFEQGGSLWFNPQMFHPFGYDVGLSETILASKALGLPFLLLGGEVVAFNLLVFVSFALSGLTMYLLVLRLTHNPWAAVLSGAIYAFAPYRIHALAAGWLPLLPTQWLPLVILCLDRTLQTRRLRPAALAGFFAALSALSSWYYAYMLAIILPIYLLLRARPWRITLRDGRLWRAALVFVAIVCLLTVPVVIPAMGLGSQGLSWSLGYADRWSASLDDFLLPNVYHPLWGQFFLSLRSLVPEYPWYAPGFIYLGIAPVLLSIYACLIAWRQRRAPARGQGNALALVVSGLASAVLALGTTLHLFGARVYIPVTGWIEFQFSRVMIVLASRFALHKAIYSPLRAVDAIPIPLPGFLAFLFLPLFSAMRHWYRFGVITTLVVAVLAGMGAAVLLSRLARAPSVRSARLPDGQAQEPAGQSFTTKTPRTPRRAVPVLSALYARVGRSEQRPYAVAAQQGVRTVSSTRCREMVGVMAKPRLAAIGLIAVVLFDFLPAPLPYGLSYTSVAQPVDSWLAAQPGDFAVMQFPLVRALNGPMLYRGIAHGKKMTYGHGTFYPLTYVEAEQTLGRFPEAASLDLLHEWGVRYVIAGSRAYDQGWGDLPNQTWSSIEQGIAASGRLRLVQVFDEAPFWKDERVSGVLQKELTSDPISVDRVYVYELVR